MLAALKLLHILCMVGTFGGLLVFQFGLPAATRAQDINARAAARFLNVLLGLGFLVGATLYVLSRGWTFGPHYNGVIGLKFTVLLAVGGLLAASKKPGKGDTLRWIACVLLALAAGSTLSL
ncbi:MAG TPA: hypothetical protein VIH35_08510 [Kiritimatiellia bacterium]|jgi:hypothetical protein